MIIKHNNIIRALIREVIATRPKIYVLVGPPGVGKSGWVEDNVHDPFIVSYDNAVKSVAAAHNLKYDDLAGPKAGQLGKIVRAHEKDQVMSAVSSGKDIVVDKTNMTVNSRKRALSIIKGRENDYEKIAVVFDHRGKEAEVIASVERRAARLNDKNISKDVMMSMFSNFVYPTPEEGFDSIITASTEPALGV